MTEYKEKRRGRRSNKPGIQKIKNLQWEIKQ